MADPTERVLSIIDDASDHASFKLGVIENMAKFIAGQMTEIHGGKFSVSINHRTQFVMIAQDDFGRGAIMPKRGEVV